MIDETLDTELATHNMDIGVLVYLAKPSHMNDWSKAVCSLSNQHTEPLDDL